MKREYNLTSFNNMDGFYPYRVRIVYQTDPNRGMVGNWGRSLMVKKKIIPEMLSWMEDNGGGHMLDNDIFMFETENQRLMFLLRWG